MDRQPTLSDLLAHRDRELGGLEESGELEALRSRIEGDPAAREAVARLARMKSELQSLPPVTPPPDVWEAIQERTGHHRRRRLGGMLPAGQPWHVATAATVFLATALAIIALNPVGAPVQNADGPQVSDPVAQLMLRSQRLEAELFTRASASVSSTSSEQALLYAIADVDAQLNELYASDGFDAAERERLWRQRVVLLESLADVQRGQTVLRPAIY